MKNIRIVLLLLLFVPLKNRAQDSTAEDYYRGDGFVSGDATQATPAPAVAPTPTPAPRASADAAPAPTPKVQPKVRTEPASPTVPVQGGQGGVFTDTSKRDRSAPVFGPFQQVFQKCAPGCNAGRAHCYGSRNNRSCHPSGNAIDVHAIICDGRSYNAYTARFKEFVDCVKTKSHGSTRWKTIFRQTTGRCASEKRNHTTCHFDHAHFSLGCTVNGRRVY